MKTVGNDNDDGDGIQPGIKHASAAVRKIAVTKRAHDRQTERLANDGGAQQTARLADTKRSDELRLAALEITNIEHARTQNTHAGTITVRRSCCRW